MNNERICGFMWFDLIFLSFLAALSEWMSNSLLGIWNSSFYFSFSTAICLIATIRWGMPGILVGVIGGMPGIWFSDMNPAGAVLFYGAANGFLGMPIILYGNRNRDLIGGRIVWLWLYTALCHICLAAGKGLVIFFLTGEKTGAKDYFGATFLIMVINMVVCAALKTREGLICDMRYYFEKGEEEDHEK